MMREIKSYKVCLKDYKNKKTVVIGFLPERRKSQREADVLPGLKYARTVFKGNIADLNALFVIADFHG